MKKIFSILLSLSLSCTILASCGAKDSSSKEDTSSKQTTSSSDSSVSSKDEVKSGQFAKAYTEKINKGPFTMEMTVENAQLGKMPLYVAGKDGNYLVKMSAMGMKTEVYILGKDSYMLMPDTKLYSKDADMDMDEIGVNTFGLDETYDFIETKEEGDLILEVYKSKITDDNDSNDSDDSKDSDDLNIEMNITYYFKSNGDLVKIVSSDELSGKTTCTIDSLKFDSEDIKLPDLTGWTEMSGDGTDIDEETQIKVMLSLFGVTEDMLKEAGYTYAQLAEMDEEEVMTVLEALGIDMSGLMDGLMDDSTADKTE